MTVIAHVKHLEEQHEQLEQQIKVAYNNHTPDSNVKELKTKVKYKRKDCSFEKVK